LTIADLRKLKEEKLAKKEQDDVSNLVWQVEKEEKEKIKKINDGLLGDDIEIID